MCTDELLDGVIEVINTREKALRLIRFARAVEKGPIKDDLHKIHARTLLIWGKQDVITPPDVARTYNDGIAGSELHWVDKCGHVPMMEQPEAFNRIFIEFLDKITDTRSAALAE